MSLSVSTCLYLSPDSYLYFRAVDGSEFGARLLADLARQEPAHLRVLDEEAAAAHHQHLVVVPAAVRAQPRADVCRRNND